MQSGGISKKMDLAKIHGYQEEDFSQQGYPLFFDGTCIARGCSIYTTVNFQVILIPKNPAGKITKSSKKMKKLKKIERKKS